MHQQSASFINNLCLTSTIFSQIHYVWKIKEPCNFTSWWIFQNAVFTLSFAVEADIPNIV